MELKNLLKGDLTEYQSIPFWSWNDELQPEELRKQIRSMNKAGIGGFFMHARGGLTTEYLGEDWMKATEACIDEAGKLGMDAWCYDENGWPSGFAGMKLLKDKENLEHFLEHEHREHFSADALAVYKLDGTKLVRVFGEEEGVTDYITVLDKQNSSVVDILNKDIVRKFLDLTHEKYYERFGKDFGKAMKGFFTDEPQYFRYSTAYTPCMHKVYKERYGGDILDELGALFVECDQAYKFRSRYWRIMNDMYMESFAKQIYDWCTEHNCQLTGHSIEENGIFGQMMCCAGIMPFYKYEHKPGVDWLGRRIATEMSPKQCGSVAQQYGIKHTLTETFACAGWDVTPLELKRIAEWQYVNGINQMCQHLYPYSIKGQRKRDYPAFYSEHNTWTKPENFRYFNDYFTTLGYMLSESREEAATAVIHPVHAGYLTFKRYEQNSVEKLTQDFMALIEKLGAAHIGHHYIDETLLKEDGGVKGAQIIMGKCAYDTIVIPEMDTIDANTAKVLKEYVANGGRLYLAGKAPTMIEGEAADLSFLRSNITFEELKNRSYCVDDKTTAVRSTMRHAEFGDFLYIVNLSDKESYSLNVKLNAKGAKLFNLATREYESVYFEKCEDGVTVPLTFKPVQSYILMLDDKAEAGAKPSAAKEWKSAGDYAVITEASENTLTLDYAALSYDGVNYTKPLPVMAVSDLLLRGKTNRKVWLKYTFTCKERPISLRVECEKMGAEAVYMNGRKLEAPKPGSFEVQFDSYDIFDKLIVGENEIVFEIDYYETEEVYNVFNGVYYEHSDGTESLINCLSYLTDIEAIYLRGNFSVTADLTEGDKGVLISENGRFEIAYPRTALYVNELNTSGYPFFGGEMTLSFKAYCDGDEKQLRIDGRFPMAKVSINGGKTHSLMFDDGCSVEGELVRGENRIDVTLVTSLRNVFGPHHYAPSQEPLGVSPDLFSGYGKWNTEAGREGLNPDYADRYAFVWYGIRSIELGK